MHISVSDKDLLTVLKNDYISNDIKEDHVHIMFRAHPNTEMSKFINAYKSASSRLIKKDFPEVRRKLWKKFS